MKRLDTTIALQGAKIPKLANTIAAEVISMILNGMEGATSCIRGD